MNWVDIFIVAMVLIFSLQGIGRSFISESLDFLFFAVAFILSLNFYGLGSALLEKIFKINHAFSSVIGFFLVWALVEIILSLLTGYILKRIPHLAEIDHKLRNFSVFPAFLRGVVTVAIILVLVATFPIQPGIKAAVDSSYLGPKVLSSSLNLEGPLKNVFGGFSESTLRFLTVEPKTNESINLGFQTNNFKVRADLEQEMIGLVNQERMSRGISALSYNSSLQGIAREHSKDMFGRGYFSHYSPEGKTVADRAQAAGIDYQVIGENLAYAPSLALAHQGLMNSPGHRANILSADYHQIGIGIMDGGVYGLMVTQVFSN